MKNEEATIMDNKMADQAAKRSWLKIPLLGLLLFGLALLAIYTVGGFILLPQIARQELVDFVSKQTHRQLAVQRIRFNPFTLAFDLEGVALREADGTPLLSFQHLSGDVAFNNLLQRHLVLESLVLQGPWVHLQIDEQGATNLARLTSDLNRGGSKDAASATGPTPIPLTLRKIRVDNGQLWVTDRTGPVVARVQLLPIDFELNDITTLPDREGPVRVRARLPHGGTFLWEGVLSLQPFGATGRFSLQSFRPGRIWAFVEDQLNIEEPHGIVDISAAYDFQLQSGAPDLTVNDIQVSIKDISVTRRGGISPLVVLSEVTLSDARYQLQGNRLSIARLHAADGTLRTVRNNSVLNWQQIASDIHASSAADTRPEHPASSTPWQVVVDDVQLKQVRLVFQERDLETPLEVIAERLDLALSARASHDGTQLQAMLQGLSIRLSDISLRQDEAAPLLQIGSATLQDGSLDLAKRQVKLGELAIQGGEARIGRSQEGIINWTRVWRPAGSPVAEKVGQEKANSWQVQLQSLTLAGLTVAVQDALPEKPLNLTLSPVALKVEGLTTDLNRPLPFDLSVMVQEGGVLQGTGELTPANLAVVANLDIAGLTLLPLQSYLQPIARVNIEAGQATLKGKLKRAGNAVALTGSASIDDLRVMETETGDTLLGWKALSLPRLVLTLDPDDLVIEEILLEQPVGKFIIAEDQSNNWQKLAKPRTAPEKAAAAAAGETPPTSLFPVKIGRVRIEQGKLDFADLSLPLKFSSQIHDLNGTIAGISSAPGARTAADLEGRVAEYGVATIKGEVDPFAPQELTDINLAFRNLEMTHLTPYTAKFLGYRMNSGKLSVDLNYQIKDRQLQGDNRILLDRLALGDKIESPEAIDAPLELAIALLQDSDGKIDLGLPVSGDLDDPQFSYGHLVWKAIGNLLTGIVTAPFRALGAAIGVKGDELDTLVFEAGSALLSPPEQEKLKTVSELLAKRPKLRLEIVPRFDPKADTRALQQRQLQVALLRQMGVKIKPGRKLDPVSLSDSRLRKAMESLYGAQFSAAKLAEKRAVGKKKKAGAASGKSAEEILYKSLYEELLSVQTVPRQALSELAQQRGKVIFKELTVRNKMPGGRVKLLKPVTTDAATPDSVASRLELAPVG